MEIGRERIEDHFERGRALADALIAAAEVPAEFYRLALNALDTAELPMVQADAGQLALLLGANWPCCWASCRLARSG